MVFFNWVKKRVARLKQNAMKYNVNPKFFVRIYCFSFLPYYAGVVMMLIGSGVLNISLMELWRFRVIGMRLNSVLTIGGFLINRLAWALPYLYIEFKGKGLRWYYPFLNLALVKRFVAICFFENYQNYPLRRL